MGWHRYLSLAWLADSRDALRGLCRCQLRRRAPCCSSAVYVAGDGAFLSGRCHPDDLLPASCSAGCRAPASPCSAPPAARACCSWRRAPPSAASCATGGGLAARLSDGFAEDAFSYLLVLRLAPFVPFFVVNIAPALFDVRLRSSWRRPSSASCPARSPIPGSAQGLDSVLLAAKAAGRDASIHDLVTPEIDRRLRRSRPCRAACRRRKTPHGLARVLKMPQAAELHLAGSRRRGRFGNEYSRWSTC